MCLCLPQEKLRFTNTISQLRRLFFLCLLFLVNIIKAGAFLFRPTIKAMSKNIVKIKAINQVFEALKVNDLDFVAVGEWNTKQISIAIDFFSKGCKQYVVAKDKSIGNEVNERGYSFNLMKFLPNSFIITKETALLCKYASTNEDATKIIRTKGQLIVNLWQLQNL